MLAGEATEKLANSTYQHGHLPGAVHLDWQADPENRQRKSQHTSEPVPGNKDTPMNCYYQKMLLWRYHSLSQKGWDISPPASSPPQETCSQKRLETSDERSSTSKGTTTRPGVCATRGCNRLNSTTVHASSGT